MFDYGYDNHNDNQPWTPFSIMPNSRFQDILPLVDQPSRYLGTETNRIRKDLDRVKLSIALAFPDLYEIGTSHFGLQILYDILNRRGDIAAERVFAPATDAEALLRARGMHLTALESRRPLGEFDIIGFSLLYELNYTNVLTMLDLAGLPFYARDRGPGHPLVIAGGPCTCNPEPVADFFDAMVVGDGESVILRLCDAWIACNAGGGDRQDLLRAWAGIPGVYIPAFFAPDVGPVGPGPLVAREPGHTVVTRAILEDLERAPFPARPVVPYGKPVHDRLRIEVARGCTRGCRFCQAGMIYRPVRERSVETLLNLAEDAIGATGYDELSLLSLSTGDYSCIVPLLQKWMDRWEAASVAVSLPSLRAGSLSAELIQQIRRVRKTGFTIAPEAGSQRMRDIINKNLSEEEIVAAVRHSFDLGWQSIKLYFMIGLPFEEDVDVQAIVDLVERLRPLGRRGGRGRGGSIHVSVATFIPKAHTPFQWAAQITVESSRRRIAWLKDRLRLPGVEFKWQDPEVSHLEGLFARGDRRLAPLLVAAHRRGCRFDGWSDHFSYRRWQEAFQEAAVDPDAYLHRERCVDEPLPWDHIDIGVTREYLRREWVLAAQGRSTGDCRHGECNACGVCDFDAIKPVICVRCDGGAGKAPAVEEPAAYRNHRLTYSKTGQARFFGHLEMVSVFLRAIRRARIAVKRSEGFHPKPKIAFEDALPIGMESLEEHLTLAIGEGVDAERVVADLNRELPEGLRVTGCRPMAGKRVQRPSACVYRVEIGDGLFDPELLAGFMRREAVTIVRANKKGRQVAIDLKQQVGRIELLSAVSADIVIRVSEGKSLRPADVLREVFQLEECALRSARVLKLKTERGAE